MNYQWRASPSGRAALNNSTSTLSPLTVCNRYQNVVPSGTVASRVHFLQSLENPPPTRGPPDKNRHRGDSRTGFGRRLASRFGSPATWKTMMVDELEIDTTHSFLGLSTPRTNHEEVHAKSGRRATDKQNKDPASQIKPQGMSKRVQYDPLSPWIAISKSQPTTSTRQDENTFQLGALRGVGLSKNKGYLPTETVVSTPKTTYNEELHRRPASQPGTLHSETSFATASTIRRQSVRELFRDYGIERPAGLASRDTSREMDEALWPARPHTYCHVCSWVNSYPLTSCWRCNHQFCVRCDDMSPPRKESNLDPKAMNASEQQIRKSRPPKENNKSPPQGCIIQKPRRPGPTPTQFLEKEKSIVRHLSSPPSKFPPFSLDVPVAQKKSIKKPPQLPIITEQPRLVPALSGSQVTTCVKNSPFLLADMMSGCQSLRLFPMSLHKSSCHSRHPKNRNQNPSSAYYSSNEECDSPACLATHDGHKPYRHSIACSRKKLRVNHDTDTGYVADTSCVEDADDPLLGCQAYFSRPHSRLSQHSRIPSCQTQISRPGSGLAEREVNVTNDYRFPEYVECHGYPRTGHARHGSPIGTGIVGECQHCLDDCQCLACQSTHHSVRCCVNKDHRTIVHHHHTPRMVAKLAKPSELPGPSVPIRDTPSPPSPPLTVIPPEPDNRASSSLALTHSPALTTPKQILSKKAEPEKAPSLPKSRRSTFIKEVPKPPAPPPWVSLFTMKSISAAPVPRVKSKETNVISTFNEVSCVDYSSPSEKIPTRALSVTCDKSTPEQRKLLNDTWVTVRTDDEIKHNHSRRESCTIPPANTTVNREKDKRPASSGVAALTTMEFSLTKDHQTLSRILKMQKRNTVVVEELRETKEPDLKFADIENGIARLERFEELKEQEHPGKRKESSAASVKIISGKKSKWKLPLVDKETRHACANDGVKPVQEHTLSDDEVADEIVGVGEHEVRPIRGNGTQNLDLKPEEHQCVWKSRVLDEKNRSRFQEAGVDPDIESITIVIHIRDREDLVFKIDPWKKGGGLNRS